MNEHVTSYPARLEVEYPERLDRVSSAFRLLWVIPIFVILALISGGGGGSWDAGDGGGAAASSGGSAAGGFAAALALMILFRRRYPRWWFDFLLELTRFSSRVGAYFVLLRDEYPSTEDAQAVRVELDYPDAGQLNRWLPLVKWLLAIPHIVVLFFLVVGAFVAVVVAWFAILFTGRYPRGLFDYVVGVGRWGLRVEAYALLMLTDRYPPFSLR